LVDQRSPYITDIPLQVHEMAAVPEQV